MKYPPCPFLPTILLTDITSYKLPTLSLGIDRTVLPKQQRAVAYLIAYKSRNMGV